MPAKPAVVFEGRTVSWSELWRQVRLASGYLEKYLDNEAPEVVALFLPNSIEFIVAYLAVLHNGHIALPLDPAYKSLELDAMIEQIPPKVLITDDDYLGRLSRPHQKRAILVDGLLKSRRPASKLLRTDPKDQIASLTFTSGTTGRPKAAPNTHANHIWNIKVCSTVWDWTERDSLLVTVPLSHMLGIVMGLSGTLYHGNTMYLQRWFDEQATMEALASGKVSFFSHAASAYAKLVQVPAKNYDLSKVRLCVSGAAPLPPAVWQEFKRRFGVEIIETYGTTETGRIAANHLGEPLLGSPGPALPEVDLKLSANGEVLIKSPGVFPGYYQNPRASAAARTSDGYWRTGDIAELRDGYIYLKGRSQERIRRFGYTISPRDVEWAMLKHPKIRDIYVMGTRSDDQPDDQLFYFVVGEADDQDIISYSKANLLFAWRPDKIVYLDELPRTRSGKPKMAELKKLTGAAA